MKQIHKSPKLTQEKIESLNRPIAHKGIKLLIKSITYKRKSSPDGFTGKFYQTFKKN